VDVLFRYKAPPALTEEIALNVVPSTLTISAVSTYTAPPSVDPVVLPVMPTLVPFAMKYELSIDKPLVALPINVPTTPFVEAAAEIPGMKEKQNERIIRYENEKKKSTVP
jgi:hypothetical protein